MIDYRGLAYALVGMGIIAMLVLLGTYPFVHVAARRWTAGKLGNWTKEELLAASVVAAICYLATVGIVLCFAPWGSRRLVALLAILIPVFGGLRVSRQYAAIRSSCKGSFFFWATVVFSGLILVIGHLNVHLPKDLPDGAYVNKEDVTAVRIQWLTGGLPADNAVPFVVQEYLARRILFRENAPILPGQEVTNRPILMSLVSLPVRLALRPVEKLANLPRFSYVGTNWPDFRVLVRDTRAFSIFLGVGVFLNACLLLALGAVTSRLPLMRYGKKLSIVLLFCTSPYFIFQTLFTWPKALAGFFLILAFWVYVMRLRGSAVGAGLLIGLAYLSHPYAIGYFVVGVAITAIFNRNAVKARLIETLSIVLSFCVVVSPWWFWANFVLGLKSDLIAQNFLTESIDPYQFLWMRINNLWSAALPMHLTSYGASFVGAFGQASVNLSGALGVVFLMAVAVQRLQLGVNGINTGQPQTSTISMPTAALHSMIGSCCAASILLTLVFSMPAVPALHGWQPFIALVLCWGIASIGADNRAAKALIWVQTAINAVQLGAYLILRN